MHYGCTFTLAVYQMQEVPAVEITELDGLTQQKSWKLTVY
jgi:hypothetical protein